MPQTRNWVVVLASIVLAAALLLVILVLSSYGGEVQWRSKPRLPGVSTALATYSRTADRAAKRSTEWSQVCRVSRGHSMGSGALVGCDKQCYGYVATAAHVGRGETGPWRVRFRGADEVTGEVYRRDTAQDLAVIKIRLPRRMLALRLRTEPLQPNERYWAGGLGSNHRLRWAVGRIGSRLGDRSGRSRWVEIAGPVRGGDSGGPVIDSNGRVAGILWGTGTGHCVATPARIVQRLLPPYCGPCGPCNPSGRQPPRVGESPPVWPGPDTDPPEPIQPEPPIVDDERLAALEQELAAVQSRLDEIALEPGPPGPPGPTGPRGPQGPPGPSPDVDTDAIAQAVYDRVMSQVEIPELPPTRISHYVLVADTGASYWPRLSDWLGRAQESFTPIRVTPPPSNYSGQLPALVGYRDGSPLEIYRGQSDVESHLNRLARGEAQPQGS